MMNADVIQKLEEIAFDLSTNVIQYLKENKGPVFVPGVAAMLHKRGHFSITVIDKMENRISMLQKTIGTHGRPEALVIVYDGYVSSGCKCVLLDSDAKKDCDVCKGTGRLDRSDAVTSIIRSKDGCHKFSAKAYRYDKDGQLVWRPELDVVVNQNENTVDGYQPIFEEVN